MTRPIVRFRREAAAALEGNWMMSAVATLILYVVTGAFNVVPVVGPVLYMLVSLPLGYGVKVLFQHVYREGEVDLGMLFDGFRDFGRVFLTRLLVGIYIMLWTLLLIVPGIIKSYSYSMTDYVLRDNPDLAYDAAVRESMRLMDGNKMSLFILDLSFIGWAILCVLTLGIGFLWLVPYVQTAHASFYETIKEESEQARMYC